MSEIEHPPVRTEIVGNVGLIILDNPPVNALGQQVRAGLIKGVEELNADEAVRVIAIYGGGRALSAGADIGEFGKPPLPPSLPDVLNTIEVSGKPIVTVIHGVALGGGLELALASHVRIGMPGTRVGLPEVNLGLLPGAGGTQRLPRLIALDKAIDIICTGRQVPVEEAVELGIIDQVGRCTPRDAALNAADEVLAGTREPRRTGEITIKPNSSALTSATERLLARRPALIAPIKAVEAISHAGKPIEEGLKAERKLFVELMESPDRQGLIHAFGAERAVRQIPEATEAPRVIGTAGVIGGGTMGVGIATALLNAGIPLTLIETTPERAETARAAVARNLNGAVRRGKMTAETRDRNLGALSTSTDLNDLSNADAVIEAVFEDMSVKTGIFRKLNQICKPGAVLGTNTSYLDVNEIAAATSRPGDVIGLHFFSPAHVMRLLEVVVADKTDPDVVATALELSGRMKKVAVRSGVCDGFIGNRILAHHRKAAEYMLLDGASFAQIDSALEAIGFAMGPFSVGDLAGLDIAWASRKRKAPKRPPEERYVTIADRICEQGWFGRKTGRGFYLYGEYKNRPVNPEAETIVEIERKAACINPRTFEDSEIVTRYMTAMISEATRVVEEGIALRPIDVDAVFLFGYGFPRHLGGPMNYADRIGAAKLIEQIETYAKEDPHYWQVPALLRQLAETGASFADMNKETTNGS
ncbi:MAG: 3-hydroxyacyl-CoA dehydrogenase NAD-binding domain-containing protein [Paracoccaceae bacterium]